MTGVAALELHADVASQTAPQESTRAPRVGSRVNLSGVTLVARILIWATRNNC